MESLIIGTDVDIHLLRSVNIDVLLLFQCLGLPLLCPDHSGNIVSHELASDIKKICNLDLKSNLIKVWTYRNPSVIIN